MKVTFEYYFVKHGEVRNKSINKTNEIWIDVGNKLDVGAFDHHQLQGYCSTADVMIKHLDLLEETILAIRRDEPIRIYTHIYPDLDVVVAVYLLRCFLEMGKAKFEESFIKNPIGRKWIEYINHIDAGRKKNISQNTLYALYAGMSAKEVQEHYQISEKQIWSKKTLEMGLQWIDMATVKMQEDEKFDLYDSVLIENGKNDELVDLITKTIQHNCAKYQREKEEGKVIIKDIELWTKDKQIETVKAAIWKSVPSCDNAYIYARQEKVALTFVPYENESGNRVFISINPDLEGADSLSLTEVAEIYEQLEQIQEQKNAKETGKLRRDYSKSRASSAESVFNKAPFAETSDPWYVSQEGDVVDAPRVGSLLSIEEMQSILLHITQMIKTSFLVEYKEKDIIEVTNLVENTCVSDWLNKAQTMLFRENNADYQAVVVEIDSAFLESGYEILGAYYMTLLKGSYLNFSESEALHIDYRSHIYLNAKQAVIFIATNEGGGKSVLLEELLHVETQQSIKESRLIAVLQKLIYQRKGLLEIGRFIGGFDGSIKKLEAKNKELFMLLSEIQQEEYNDKKIEQQLSKHIKEVFQIETLKNSVADSMSVLMEYQKEKTYERINKLSIITAPALLFCTVFQIGFIQFPPVWVVNDGENVVWAVTFGIITIITILMFYRGKRKK